MRHIIVVCVTDRSAEIIAEPVLGFLRFRLRTAPRTLLSGRNPSEEAELAGGMKRTSPPEKALHWLFRKPAKNS